MPEFLAETYAPRGAPGTAAPRPAQVAAAAGHASQPGAPVRLLAAIGVPEEETCFWLYQAPSAAAVRTTMTLARLRPQRITTAISIRPPRARPGPAPGLRGPRSGPPHHTGPPAPGTGPP
jgi:hypothetical protein